MNMIAIDIGNSTVTVALFLDDEVSFVESIPGADDDAPERLAHILTEAWGQIPFVEDAKVKKRNGLIVVSSVRDDWTRMTGDICAGTLDEKIKVIGKDVPLPIEMAIENPSAVGTDRVVNAAAAFAVIENACVVADFGTAVTIDLVDEEGVFHGGVIAPGFEIGAKALEKGTAKLPLVKVTPAKDPVGANTADAINAGLFYSAVGLLRIITEKFAEQIGRWPQTVVTGGAADLLKDECNFVDSWVKNLTVRGVFLAYKKHLANQAELGELGELSPKKQRKKTV